MIERADQRPLLYRLVELQRLQGALRVFSNNAEPEVSLHLWLIRKQVYVFTCQVDCRFRVVGRGNPRSW